MCNEAVICLLPCEHRSWITCVHTDAHKQEPFEEHTVCSYRKHRKPRLPIPASSMLIGPYTQEVFLKKGVMQQQVMIGYLED